MNSSKKRTNEFVFTTTRHVSVRFLEEIEDTKKTFRNYLTFSKKNLRNKCDLFQNNTSFPFQNNIQNILKSAKMSHDILYTLDLDPVKNTYD